MFTNDITVTFTVGKFVLVRAEFKRRKGARLSDSEGRENVAVLSRADQSRVSRPQSKTNFNN